MQKSECLGCNNFLKQAQKLPNSTNICKSNNRNIRKGVNYI